MRPPALSVTMDKAKMHLVERAAAEIPKALPRIMVRSLKRTAAGGRTELDRQIRAQLTVKKRAVMKRIVDEQKATSTHWLWRLGISRTRISLGSFRHRWSKRRGVSYSIRKGQKRSVPSGFVRENPHANEDTPKAIFRRAERGGRLVSRYPLLFLRGPSLGKVLIDAPAMLRKVHQTGSARLEREVFHGIDRTLQKRWPK